MKLGLALFLTLTSLFISGQCQSQCAVFTPSMSITQVNPGSPPFGEDVPKAIDGNIYTKSPVFKRFNCLCDTRHHSLCVNLLRVRK